MRNLEARIAKFLDDKAKEDLNVESITNINLPASEAITIQNNIKTFIKLGEGAEQIAETSCSAEVNFPPRKDRNPDDDQDDGGSSDLPQRLRREPSNGRAAQGGQEKERDGIKTVNQKSWTGSVSSPTYIFRDHLDQRMSTFLAMPLVHTTPTASTGSLTKKSWKMDF